VGAKQWKAVTDALQIFGRKAAETCQEESFDPVRALTVERELEIAGVSIGRDDELPPLKKCLPRMLEATGLAGGLPFRMRHCGAEFDGTWDMQVTTNIMVLTGTAQVAGNSGSLSASGTVHDPSSRPYQMTISGTLSISVEETKDSH